MDIDEEDVGGGETAEAAEEVAGEESASTVAVLAVEHVVVGVGVVNVDVVIVDIVVEAAEVGDDNKCVEDSALMGFIVP